MMEKDADGGKKQRTRALFYQPVVLEVLVQLGLYQRHVPTPPKKWEGGM